MHAHKALPAIKGVCVAGKNIKVLSSARNIGVTFDSHFNLEKHVMNTCKTAFFHVCISQFHLRPAPKGIGIFFALDGKSLGVGNLELSNPPVWGRKKRSNTPSSVNKLQQFSLIALLNSAILSILKFDFLFQLTSSFVIALGF